MVLLTHGCIQTSIQDCYDGADLGSWRSRRNRPVRVYGLGQRAIRQLVAELETMGVVTAWTESRGREGRALYVETTFDPAWVHDLQAEVVEELVPDSAD